MLLCCILGASSCGAFYALIGDVAPTSDFTIDVNDQLYLSDDTIIHTGDVITLDASPSIDLDGDDIFYYWSVKAEGVSVSLTDYTAKVVTFTPSIAGKYEISLTVTSSFDRTAIKSISFIVQ